MAKKLPFISVIIRAYNEEKYLPRCLDALKAQTYPKERYSILVVDNNSSDSTAAIAKKYGAKVITERKQGRHYSLDTGFKNAVGDIFAVTDADCQTPNNWLETIAKVFEDPTLIGMTGSLEQDFKSPLVNYLHRKVHHLVWDFNFLINKPLFSAPNMALRNSAFKKLKEVDLRYEIAEDVAIGMRLRKYGKVRFVKSLPVTISSRRFKKGINIKDMYTYTKAYIYTVLLEKPPRGDLAPIR